MMAWPLLNAFCGDNNVGFERPRFFSIPPGLPFADLLAQGLIERHGEEPLGLSRVLIYLPTRRAARTLRESFLRLLDGRPMLLPDMRALGDADEDEIWFSNPSMGAPPPPAISSLRRALMLSRLIGLRPDAPPTAGGQLALAQELAALLDSLQIEEKNFDGFNDLAPADLAQHWQITLKFLEIIRTEWPRLRLEDGVMDPAARRVRLIDAEAARIAQLDRPVYVAGSTGSAPATAHLIKEAAKKPDGGAILPGYLPDIDQEGWHAIADDPTHALHGLAKLVAAAGDGPAGEDIAIWPPAEKAWTDARRRRALMLRDALWPADLTDRWSHEPKPKANALDGLHWFVAKDEQEEALAIALVMRDALEKPGIRVALVTPNRELARRVIIEAHRFDLILDDSAGQPLRQTAAGRFFMLCAAAVLEEWAPIAFLSLMKHPFAAFDCERAEHLARLRRIEKAVLHGPRPAPGLEGLLAAMKGAQEEKPILQPEDFKWIEKLNAAAAPFTKAAETPNIEAREFLALHIAFAEDMAGGGSESRLWRGEDGAALSDWLAAFAHDCAGIDLSVAPKDWPGLLRTAMGGASLRPRGQAHPRAMILGPLEARLQSADLVILGGLNEGVWPPTAQTGAWLNRPMRASLDLPQPERAIGLAAHDFWMLASQPHVLLTRAEKNDNAPTLPSRWWQRLETLLGQDWAACEAKVWAQWARRYDVGERLPPLLPPAPRPPVTYRPRSLSVTQVETLIRDPYAIYARYVLGLKPLDPIDADPGASEKGIALHEALEEFIRRYPATLPPDAHDILLKLGEEKFAPLLARPLLRSFFWPRYVKMAERFLEVEATIRVMQSPVLIEGRGELIFDAPAGPFRLTAKADRIDRKQDGSGYSIIDYKSGKPPTKDQVLSGLAPQLPLEGAILIQGGFTELGCASIADLVYIHLQGKEGEILKIVPSSTGDLTHESYDALAIASLGGLQSLIAAYDKPEQPYLSWPRPQFLYTNTLHTTRGDYNHLARVLEWREGGEVK